MPMLGGDMIYLDSTDKQVKSLKVGDDVEITIKGKVKELEGSRTYKYGPDDDEDVDKIPARIGIQVKSQKLNGEANEFSRMAEEEMTDG